MPDKLAIRIGRTGQGPALDMNPFQPRFQGELDLPTVPQDFTSRIADRVRQGLFLPGSRNRANYSVRGSTLDEIRFGADDLWTAINVGLNEVEIRRVGTDCLSYDVQFRRWRNYAVGLGLIMAGVFALIILGATSMGFEKWIGAGQMKEAGGIAIGAFFCLLWPWILVAIHKRFAAKCLVRILRETLAT